jgi:energy-coupling factor transporter ATP-binding protein EcfA2
MDQILLVLEEFYKNHEKLAIALASSLATCVLTLVAVFIRRIVGAIRNIVVWIGKQIGGTLSYKSFLDSYLNWMVAEYQDLINLTGIIGSGPKPKLEQVFISLSFSRETEPPLEEPRTRLAKAWHETRSVLWPKKDEPEERPSKIIKRAPETITFYQRRRAYKIKGFFERNVEFLIILLLVFILALIIGLFAVLPAYLLFRSTTSSVWIIGFAGLISGLAVILLLWGLLESLIEKEISLILLAGIPLALYILIGAFLVYTKGIPPKRAAFASIGAALSIGVISIWRWTVSRRALAEGEFADRIRKLLNRYDNVAILGRPGAGKSTLVQFLALAFAREKAGEGKLRKRGVVVEKLGLDTWYLPILIPLRKVSKTLLERDADGNANLLLEAWRDKVLPSDIRADFPDKFFLKMLKKRRCILLLDGLDEVANDEEFRTVIREIKGFSSRYAGNKFIITSRFSGWRGGVGSTFQEFRVDDLTDGQIGDFIDDWYQAIEENRVLGGLEAETPTEKAQRLRKARSRAKDLKDALHEVESIRRLAENPLLLSIICFVHYHKTLPRERLSLYQDCSNLLLLQWDREKGLPVDDTDLTLKRKEAIMQEIAFAMHTGRIGKEFGGKEATGREIIPIIEEKLGQFRLPVENARSLFQKLINRSGIIVSVERYTDRFSFSHLTFQEFYTAQYIFENRLDILTHFADESIERLTGWWREVVLLYVSMVKDSSKLIHEMCKPTLINLDDLAGRRLQIAAQCLLQAVAVQDETIEQMILQNLVDVRLGAKGSISIDASCPKELRTYLINFANAPTFSRSALRFAVNELKQNADLDALAARLLKLSRSADSDVATASLGVLRELTDTHDLKEVLSPDDIIALFEHPSEEVGAEALHFVCTQDDLLAKRAVLEKVISIIFEGGWKIGKLYEGPYQARPRVFRTLPGFGEAELQLVAQLPKVPYESESDKRWIQNALWEAFHRTKRWVAEVEEFEVGYSVSSNFEVSSSTGYGSTKYTTAIAASIVLLSEKEKISYAAEFLEMLRTGSAGDQQLAVEVLSLLLQEIEIEGAIEELIQALQSPYAGVRHATLEALKTIDLSPSQVEQSVSILETGLRSFHFLRRASIYLGKVFTGKGPIGVSLREKQAIIRIMTKLNAHHTPQELENLLLSFIDDRTPWSVVDAIETLASEFDHRLDSEIASRLMRIYRNLVALYGDGDYLKIKGRGSYPKRYLLSGLVKLAERLDMEDKRQVAQLLLEEMERAESDYLRLELFRGLHDLEVDSTAIPEGMRTRILALLEHKSWDLADAAFEVAVRYEMI